MSDIPTREPGEIYAGDSLRWNKSISDHPAGDGWTLHYALFNADGTYSFDATADGDTHVVDVAASTTANWSAGRYDWTAYVDNASGERKVVGTGTWKVHADPTSGAHDGRTHARKMLDAIEATLEGRATASQLDLVSTAYGGRNVQRDPEKLIPLRDKYKAEVDAEEAAARIARGEKVQNKLKVRF